MGKNLRMFYQTDNAQNSIDGLYDLIEFARDNIELNTMAEIGCFAGISTKVFLDNFKKVYCIDSWGKGYNGIKKEYLIEAKKRFNENLSKYTNKIVIEKKSYKAANDITEMLDMVYIDAGHTYKDVRNDIMIWSQKVREGGIIAGHDYTNIFDVRKAVNEFFKKPFIFSDCSWAVIK